MSLMPIKKDPQTDFAVNSDKALQTYVSTISKSQQNIQAVDATVREMLAGPRNKVASYVARLLGAVVPEQWWDMMPVSMVKYVADEYDALEYMEGLMREGGDRLQLALKNVLCVLEKKSQDIKDLDNDLARAKREGWDAEALQQYISERAEIKIYEEVARFLNAQFSMLSQEERSRQQEVLLSQLHDNVEIGARLIDILIKVSLAGYEAFRSWSVQYFNYMEIYKPMIAVRDAGQTLTDANLAMFIAKDAVRATYLRSLDAIELGLEGVKILETYSLVSHDMQKLFDSGRERLEKKLLELTGASNNNTLLIPHGESTYGAVGRSQ